MTTKQTTVVVRLDEVMKGYDELKKLIGVLLAPNLGTPQCVPIPPEAIKRIVAQEISFYPLDDYCEAERKVEDPVFRSIEDQNIHFLVEYEVDNEATRAHLEEVVVAEHAALVGKVILVNSVTGYLGDTDDQVLDRHLDPPVAFIVDEMGSNDGLLHWTDGGWIDPYWDLTPVNPADPQIADMRSWWCFGPSHHVDGSVSKERVFVPAPDPVTLTIEYVKVGNDNTDAVDWDLGALAAICYEAGEHQGVHYLVPVNGSQGDMDAARDVLFSMIEGSAFPYRVANSSGKEQA